MVANSDLLPMSNVVASDENLPEVDPRPQGDLEVKHEDYPQVVQDLPEVYNPEGTYPEVVPPMKQPWWRKHCIWLAVAVVLVLVGAVAGGVAGGTRHKSAATRNSSGDQGIGDMCKNSADVAGTCMKTADCASSGGTSEAGHCPGAKDIQCCTKIPLINTDLQTAAYPIPTAVSWGLGRLDMLGKTQTHDIWHRGFDNGSWDPSYEVIRPRMDWNTNLAVLSRGPESIDVFFVGRDNSTYQKAYNKTDRTWVPHDDFGFSLSGNLWSTIDAISWEPRQIDMFSLDGAGKVIHQIWNSTGWYPWTRVAGSGGPSTYLFAPTALAWSVGVGHLFIVEQQTLEVKHTIWKVEPNSNVTTYPTLFASLGHKCTSRPSAVAWKEKRIDLVCRGLDSKIAWTTYNGQSWSEWTTAGNSPAILAEPHIVSYAEGELDVVVKSKDSALRIGFYTEGSTMGWQWFLMAEGVKGAPRAAAYGKSPETNSVVFVYAGNNSLLYLPYRRTRSAKASDFVFQAQDLGTPG